MGGISKQVSAKQQPVAATGKCLHWFLDDISSRNPGSAAAVSDQGTLTYGELSLVSNQLATLLHRRGIGTGDRIAIHLPRSLETLIAILGVLKSGAAYVPIDPDNPENRKNLIVSDSRPKFVITNECWGRPSETNLIAWNSLQSEFSKLTGTDPIREVDPESPAYVIYTSGSTGQPKGVYITHQGVCRYVDWMNQNYSLGTADSVLQKTSFGWDVSVAEMFTAWAAGATLVLCPPGMHKDPSYLLDLISDKRITSLFMVPSQLEGLLRHQSSSKMRSLKYIFTTGEALPAAMVRELQTHFPEIKLCNQYGPTEISIVATHWECGPLKEGEDVPVGRPFSYASAWVLDEDFNEVPDGTEGEIYLGGPSLGLGYWDRPAITAERFLPNPFSRTPGDRFYRTGDRGVRTVAGMFYYRGRTDTQVKVRGYRVELGEIEVILCRLPHVKSAMVVQQSTGKLVAFLCANLSVTIPHDTDLKTALQKDLPDYMIPDHFRWLDAIPRNLNGKPDRAALALMEVEAPRVEKVFTPQSSIQNTVWEIWKRVLRMDHVGVKDNFFDLGGNSLMLAEVQYWINEKLNLNLPIIELFQYPTVLSLSTFLQSKVKNG